MNRDEGRNCNSCVHNGYDSIRLACAFCVPQEASQWEDSSKAQRTADELIACEDLSRMTRPELNRLCAILRKNLAKERRLKSEIQAKVEDDTKRLISILRDELAEERRLKYAIQAQANEELERRRAAEAQLLALKEPRP